MDVSEVTIDQVIDISYALVAEAYVGAGMNMFEALEKIDGIGRPETEVAKAPKPEDEAANMALLTAAMSKTGFKGGKL